VESNWVHSALQPLIGLLCQPRVIMMMIEKLVEWWLAEKTEVPGENLPQCRFVHHKPHMPAQTRTRSGAVGNQRPPVTNRLSYGTAFLNSYPTLRLRAHLAVGPTVNKIINILRMPSDLSSYTVHLDLPFFSKGPLSFYRKYEHE
jgi:hypothetical protein